MSYTELLACPSLRSLVSCYWTMAGGAPAHRVLPDGSVDILLIGGTPKPIWVGTMTQAIVAPPMLHGVVGIRFRPGEVARLLPATHELTNRNAPIDDLWPEGTASIEDALGAALELLASPTPFQNAPTSLATRLDRALGRCLAKSARPTDLRVRTATDLLAKGMSVREVSAAVCLSERQLARRFETRVGVSPKVFARVMRLQRATAAITAGASVSAAAELAGYADQAHFTREARALSLVTPGVLASELAPSVLAEDVSDSFKTSGPAAA